MMYAILILFLILVPINILRKYLLRKKLPPGPIGLPILGNLLVLHKKNIPDEFHRLRKQYGDIFSLQLGSNLVIVVNGYDAIKDVFVRRGEDFNDRPDNFLNLHLMKHSGIICSNGNVWKEQRTFGMATLRHLGLGTSKLEFYIQEECVTLVNAVKRTNEAPFDIHYIIQNAVANIIVSLSIGRKFDYGDPTFKKLATLFDELALKISAVGLIDAFPVLRKLPYDWMQHNRIRSIIDEAFQFLKPIVEEHKDRIDKENPCDFIDYYLLEIKKQENKNSSFTDYQLLIVLVNFFVAGTETTVSTILWSIAYLLHYPNIKSKLHDEIDSIVGSNIPSMKHKNDMHYMSAFLEEILRIADLAPLAFEHSARKDTTLFGYYIPKHASIIPNLNSVAFDPTLFDDPRAFKPERFLDENGKYVPNLKNIPFGIGQRVCFGELLAKTELFLLMTSLLQHFDFQVSGTGLPSLDPVLGSVNFPKPYTVKAVTMKA